MTDCNFKEQPLPDDGFASFVLSPNHMVGVYSASTFIAIVEVRGVVIDVVKYFCLFHRTHFDSPRGDHLCSWRLCRFKRSAKFFFYKPESFSQVTCSIPSFSIVNLTVWDFVE